MKNLLNSRANSFSVVVRTLSGTQSYAAIGTDSAAVHIAAIDRFGVCGVTVTPQARRPQ